MNCDEVEELAGAYALGALPPSDLKGFEEHVSSCSKHPDLAELGAVARTLALAVPDSQPPLALKARIMDVVRGESRDIPETARRPSILEWLRRLTLQRAVPYALGGALAVALVALVLTNTGGSTEPRTSVITLSGDGEARAVVHVLEDGLITMEAAGLAPLSNDQTYQVWGITDEGPSSLGLLGPATDGEALGAMRADLSGVDSLAVTVEPAGGSAQPTTAPVLEADV